MGILTKYQAIIVGAIMLTSIALLGREHLKKKLSRFPFLILIAIAVIAPWIAVSYQLYASNLLSVWIYALNVGNPGKLLYTMGLTGTGLPRFPAWFYVLPSWLQTPLFYFTELAAPYVNIHPISIILYGLGLLGLGFFAWRRKTLDLYFLIWFFVTYIFFTAIPNKEWRYMVPVFPVLAVSTAVLLVSALSSAQGLLKNLNVKLTRKSCVQGLAIFLIALTTIGVVYSVNDAASWVSADQIHVPVQEAAEYVGSRLTANESIMVICAQNLFSADMVTFYLHAQGEENSVYQYPANPVDSYTIAFDVTALAYQCREYNVKYVLMYEYGADVPYFNTTLTAMDIYQQLSQSGEFGNLPTLLNNGTIASGTVFGTSPRQVYVMTYLG